MKESTIGDRDNDDFDRDSLVLCIRTVLDFRLWVCYFVGEENGIQRLETGEHSDHWSGDSDGLCASV